jgi:uncharacterized protein (TIGR03067 family)
LTKESAMRTAKWMGACVFFLALYPLGAVGQDKAKDEKFDAAKMAGTWTYVSGVKNGEKVDPDRFKDSKVTITKDTMTLEGPAGKFVLKYTLDTKKNPVTISMKMTEGAGEGATAEGIVRVKGDDLTICYAREGERPKKFEAKEGSNHHLFVLKRSK